MLQLWWAVSIFCCYWALLLGRFFVVCSPWCAGVDSGTTCLFWFLSISSMSGGVGNNEESSSVLLRDSSCLSLNGEWSGHYFCLHYAWFIPFLMQRVSDMNCISWSLFPELTVSEYNVFVWPYLEICFQYGALIFVYLFISLLSPHQHFCEW